MPIELVTVPYGLPAARALHDAVAAAKTGDALAPVTVIVPTNYVGVAARRTLGGGELGPVHPGGDRRRRRHLPHRLPPRRAARGTRARRGRSPTRVRAGARGGGAGGARRCAGTLPAGGRTPCDRGRAGGGPPRARSDRPRRARRARTHRTSGGRRGPHQRPRAGLPRRRLVRRARPHRRRGPGGAGRGAVARRRRHGGRPPPSGRVPDVGRPAPGALRARAGHRRRGGHRRPARRRAVAHRARRGSASTCPPTRSRRRPRPASSRPPTPTTRCGRSCDSSSTRLREGVPLERMAVLHGAPEPYARLVHEQLDGAGIPHNGAAVRTLADSVLGRGLLGLLALPDHGFQRHDVMRLLASTPVFRGGRAVPAARWERISRAAEIVRGPEQWQQRLDRYARASSSASWRRSRPSPTATPTPSPWRASCEHARGLQDFVATLVRDLDVDPAAGWHELAAWAEQLVHDHLAPESRRVRLARHGTPGRREDRRRARPPRRARRARGVARRRRVPPHARARARRRPRARRPLRRRRPHGARRPRASASTSTGSSSAVSPRACSRRGCATTRSSPTPIARPPTARSRCAPRASTTTTAACSPRWRAHATSACSPSHAAISDARPSACRRASSPSASAPAPSASPTTCGSSHADWYTPVPSFAAGLARVEFPATEQEHRLRTLLDHARAGGAVADHDARTRRRRARSGRGGRRRRASSSAFTRFDGNLAGLDTGRHHRRRGRRVADAPPDLRAQPVRLPPRPRAPGRGSRAAGGALRGHPARPREPRARGARRLPRRGARPSRGRPCSRHPVERRRPRPAARDRRGAVRGLRGPGPHRAPPLLAPGPAAHPRRARPLPHRGLGGAPGGQAAAGGHRAALRLPRRGARRRARPLRRTLAALPRRRRPRRHDGARVAVGHRLQDGSTAGRRPRRPDRRRHDAAAPDLRACGARFVRRAATRPSARPTGT